MLKSRASGGKTMDDTKREEVALFKLETLFKKCFLDTKMF